MVKLELILILFVVFVLCRDTVSGLPYTGGYFSNPSSCRHYFQCVQGHLFSHKCRPEAGFLRGRCVPISMVRGCANFPTYPPPVAGAEHSLYADPPSWGVEYPGCIGRMQSPINILSSSWVNPQLGHFEKSIFSGVPTHMKLKNNGHSVEMEFTDGYVIDNPSLLPGAFKAVQFHFHWGGPGQKGSEHTLDGVRFFGEMHIVHYNTKYKSIQEATLKRDGLAVLAYFIKETNPIGNSIFENLLYPIRKNLLKYDGTSYTFPYQFPIGALLPHGKGTYYRYSGSLTTPGCFETVTWTVFQDPIRISRDQANVLQTKVFENKPGLSLVPLYNNYRQVQRPYGRVVRKSPDFH